MHAVLIAINNLQRLAGLQLAIQNQLLYDAASLSMPALLLDKGCICLYLLQAREELDVLHERAGNAADTSNTAVLMERLIRVCPQLARQRSASASNF